jgi:hypothetical protein
LCAFVVLQYAGFPKQPTGAAVWMRNVMEPFLRAAHPGWGEDEAVEECMRLFQTDEAY